ncbi:caspase-7-like isoform X2 [Patiria miniata]|uniref:Caspase-3 n=1 Tax=Patiria miniata TaxID=46514 RepID=A0A914APB4_PATMI|nr:caspase-7-like isoform X2 [Patiria miniata]
MREEDACDSTSYERSLKINEVSAQDDDEESLPATGSQSTSCIHRHMATEFTYDMSHASRGKVLIVNNVNFAPATNMSKRAGSEKDADELADALRLLGFGTERYKDLTCSELERVFQNVSAQDHSDCDCFMFCIMTHGSNSVIYCTDGVLYLEDLMQELKGDRCKTLAGKPKVFFIQACRGELLDNGVELPVDDQGTDEVDSGGTLSITPVIPAEADFLVAYSSPPGYFSWRNVSLGAWFIQALVKVLKDHGPSLEINQLLTRVNHVVAYEYSSNSSMPDFDNKKQMPYYTSTLTKELYFHSNNH